MDAILESEDLSYKFPSTVKELDDAAQGFESLTTQAAIKGCVACMVGYLLQIKVPSSSETGNVKAYFSGHYQTYGINVQAACNHKCMLAYAAIAASGGAYDIAAFTKTQLSQMIKKLPARRFVVGDNAYVCSETLIYPFSGVEKDDLSKDALNFYLSQLRIHKEQKFGLMTGKWRILHQPLQTCLKIFGKIFMCITRLHNFCINEGNTYLNRFEDNQGSDRESVPLPVNESIIPGSSVLRYIIVNDLVHHGLERPTFS